ncbi:MAG: DUF1830 domain-containing protein [Cyanobacteriota bacterium]|nr:DUF1830 domain-containing protein [Cyanobacteriota bacterium]
MVSCCYRNFTDQLMVLRCVGPERFLLEKVLFPFDAFGFEAPEQANIELWSSETSLEETLEVVQLQALSPLKDVCADQG